MIIVDRISNVKRGRQDEAFAIVRSMRNPSERLRQLDVLSPSRELFFEYRRLESAGEWNAEAFRTMYVPRFLREMRAPEARDALNRLYAADRDGRTVALACFCRDERLCHRSVVAGLLQGAGANVRLPSGADYSAYYAAYRAL